MLRPDGTAFEVRPRPAPPLPDSISDVVLRAASELLIRRVGEEYFRKHFTFERAHSYAHSHGVLRAPADTAEAVPCWSVVYRFRVPKRTFVDHRVSVNVDLEGRPVPMPFGISIGDCIHEPRECEFPIDEKKAKRLAREAGLEDGIRPWEAGFTWNVKLGFIWGVKNTTVVKQGGCSGEGNMILVDANDGEIVQRSFWTSICCFGPVPSSARPVPYGPPPPSHPSSPTEPVR